MSIQEIITQFFTTQLRYHSKRDRDRLEDPTAPAGIAFWPTEVTTVPVFACGYKAVEIIGV